MEEAAGKGGLRKFSFSDMERQLEEVMRENAGAREVKPLRECSRGVLVGQIFNFFTLGGGDFYFLFSFTLGGGDFLIFFYSLGGGDGRPRWRASCARLAREG